MQKNSKCIGPVALPKPEACLLSTNRDILYACMGKNGSFGAHTGFAKSSEGRVCAISILTVANGEFYTLLFQLCLRFKGFGINPVDWMRFGGVQRGTKSTKLCCMEVGLFNLCLTPSNRLCAHGCGERER